MTRLLTRIRVDTIEHRSNAVASWSLKAVRMSAKSFRFLGEMNAAHGIVRQLNELNEYRRRATITRRGTAIMRHFVERQKPKIHDLHVTKNK